MDFLRVESLSKQKGARSALQDISFTVGKAQQLGIAGETGSGKSTLLKIIAGFEQADKGKVYFKGSRVEGPNEKLVPGHPGIAYLSQHFELRNHYRVEEILEYATLLSADQASTIFKLCRIGHLLKRKTDQLSGGEKQRIALARLLVSSPSLLILDEPFSNLDIIHKTIIRSVIDELQTELGISCILVSHDPTDLLSWADSIIILRDGSLIQQDSPQELYRKPIDAYAARLMGPLIEMDAPLASYLSASWIIDRDQTLSVRPEDIRLKANGPAEAMIVGKHFFGHYYAIDLEVMNHRIRIRTGIDELSVGDTVRIWLDPERLMEL